MICSSPQRPPSASYLSNQGLSPFNFSSVEQGRERNPRPNQRAAVLSNQTVTIYIVYHNHVNMPGYKGSEPGVWVCVPWYSQVCCSSSLMVEECRVEDVTSFNSSPAPTAQKRNVRRAGRDTVRPGTLGWPGCTPQPNTVPFATRQ